MDYKLMGKNIAEIRLKNHLTQEALAEKIDVSTVFISQIETSVRKPSLDTVYKLSVALNTTVDALIGNDTNQAKYEEIIRLLHGRTSTELAFITGVLREICSNLNDDKIVLNRKCNS